MEISIIVPVYNVQNYLSQCIESILYQDFNKEYEIICINDGSSDSSLRILKDYERENKKVIVVDQLNRGLSGARNTGLKLAKGKFVMFIDSDDFLTSNKVLSLMYKEINEHHLDFLVADFEYYFEDKSKNYRMKRSKVIKNKIMSGKEFYEKGLKTKSIKSVVWNKLYKKDFLTGNNLYFKENILYEDMEFTPKVYFLANRVKYMDESIIMYRQREGSITKSDNLNRLDDYFVIADRLNDFNKKYNSPVLLNSELYIYILILGKINHLKDKKMKKEYIVKLKKENCFEKFAASNKYKYKFFGLLHYMKYLSVLKKD